MDKEGLKFLQEKTDFPICKSVIHTSIKVKESVFQHIPVVRYAPKCRPAADYRGFVREIVPELGTEEE
jgi:cellulose biosynthesis protein BcsQ